LPRGQQPDPAPAERQSAGALGLMRSRTDAEAAMKPAHAERIDAVNDDAGAGDQLPPRTQYAAIDDGVSIAAGRVIHAIHAAHNPQTINTAIFSGVR
jgi:hypothetical protein